MEYARELGLGLKLIGTAERVDGGLSASACTRRSSTAGTRWPAVNGPVQRGHDRVRGDHRDHAVRARAPAARRPPAPCSATSISAMIPPASTPRDDRARCEIVSDVESAFYLHLEVADRPGVLAQVAQLLGLQGASIQLGRAEGAGRERAAGDGHAPDARVAASTPALRADRPASTSCARAPRAIRVIDEEFAVSRMPGLIERYRDRLPFARGRPRRLAAGGLDAARARAAAVASASAPRCG